ncbi:proline-rich receptor-like protein kinase PERK4 [Trifolium pratense]|uniref:proline-rich receptor-like protein kinase PERK4 n=1 Tax=Trifolium pratense TaxID=57577 RepID=UPI001E692DBB|nr:proline-rich receptor-like protein kinase PERK4 [Trifolium pratense]
MSSLRFITGIIITVILAGASTGRDLRPSDHGLSFQSPPPANSPTEMRSFFNSNNNSSNSSSSDNSPWGITDSIPPAIQRTTGNGGGRLGKALVWGSLVCGITGGVLLVVSIFIYLFNKKRRRNSEQNDSFRFDDDNNFNLNNSNNVAKKQELVQNY